MANNRLWAVCKDDNKCTALAKNYSDWYCVGEEEGHNAFFLKHADCPSNHGCGENILFVTEVDDDRVELFDFSDPADLKIILKQSHAR